eukprot:NODE_1636_length_1870_cov_30.815684_g1384_i0.p1 GENE.NODE_1636_length_1870_cov_30.815684_g1384_i0~~NODE_1636_length_1870_cov_30.815684_g1384_i0.p1  ORF type:complete len:582 (+),score=173.59 NODE_1636_length_1870_cov_30.815684_g1384_i0:104-1747(+)
MFSKSRNRSYWFNKTTQQSQWKPPQEQTSVPGTNSGPIHEIKDDSPESSPETPSTPPQIHKATSKKKEIIVSPFPTPQIISEDITPPPTPDRIDDISEEGIDHPPPPPPPPPRGASQELLPPIENEYLTASHTQPEPRHRDLILDIPMPPPPPTTPPPPPTPPPSTSLSNIAPLLNTNDTIKETTFDEMPYKYSPNHVVNSPLNSPNLPAPTSPNIAAITPKTYSIAALKAPPPMSKISKPKPLKPVEIIHTEDAIKVPPQSVLLSEAKESNEIPQDSAPIDDSDTPADVERELTTSENQNKAGDEDSDEDLNLSNLKKCLTKKRKGPKSYVKQPKKTQKRINKVDEKADAKLEKSISMDEEQTIADTLVGMGQNIMATKPSLPRPKSPEYNVSLSIEMDFLETLNEVDKDISKPLIIPTPKESNPTLVESRVDHVVGEEISCPPMSDLFREKSSNNDSGNVSVKNVNPTKKRGKPKAKPSPKPKAPGKRGRPPKHKRPVDAELIDVDSIDTNDKKRKINFNDVEDIDEVADSDSEIIGLKYKKKIK